MMVAPTEARPNLYTSSQHLFENQGVSRNGRESPSKTPHSLIISPNLDALLEFDRKVRGIQSSPGETSPPLSSPPIQHEPEGLPVPPRRKARPHSRRSPTSPKISSPLVSPVIEKKEPLKEASVNVTIQNPYINSPPSLEMLVDVDDTLVERGDQKPRDRQNLQAQGDATPDGDRQAPVENSRAVRHQKSLSVNPSTVTVATKRKVDKLLGIGKIPFGLFSESNDTSPSTSPKSPKAPEKSPPFQSTVPNLKERAKARGKLLKPLKDPAMIESSQHPGPFRSDIVLDIRRQGSPVQFSTASDRERHSERVEPHSHDNFTVPPPRPSFDSISSTSSYLPPSTVDDRISISSAINPSSVGHAYADMYHTPVIPPHRASSLYESSFTSSFERRNSERESFIDMVSPIMPEFAIPSRSDDIPFPKAPSRTSSPKPSRTSSPKPPLPTTPKPFFNRLPARSSSAPRQDEAKHLAEKLPPTTNFLDLDERSELIRKNRKIAQVLGQSPGPDVVVHPDVSVRASRMLQPSLSGNGHHVRGTLSLSNDYDLATSSSTPRTQSLTLDGLGRRHSSPMSPDFVSQFSNMLTDDHAKDSYGASSRESFIDLSDDLGPAALATPKDFGHDRPPSPSEQSIFENMTPEEQAEELRRRKREKLAKLHRFLGSRVPADLVLGLEDPDSTLPPCLDSTIVTSPMDSSPTVENDDATKKAWVRRRRSSSAAILTTTWSDEVDRIKEDLNAKEKAVNVRRAQKMEKMFGVAPPQTLYHTRRSPSPSVGNALAIASNKLVSGWTAPGENHPPVTGQRNPNRTSYTKPKKKEHRPGTSESSKALLPKNHINSSNYDEPPSQRFSVYSHYQESLNSLNDIIDRDDRESLAELHEYLNSGDMSISPVTPIGRSGDDSGERRLSISSSIKSERRRSLPARTSMTSLASEYNASTPKPEVMDFQARRRRAAKLTQFFGVDYRELIRDVLESIESGLEHEQKRGTLNADEIQDLQAKLRKLRVKREGIS